MSPSKQGKILGCFSDLPMVSLSRCLENLGHVWLCLWGRKSKSFIGNFNGVSHLGHVSRNQWVMYKVFVPLYGTISRQAA